MICRRCIQRVSAQAGRQLAAAAKRPAAPPSSSPKPFLVRSLSTTPMARNAAAQPPPPPSASAASAAAAPGASSSSKDDAPAFSTPLDDGAPGEKPSISACVEGTVMKGLNFLKDKQDPVALADDKYPPWLWKCLQASSAREEDNPDEVDAEYSKSKKTRRVAAKKQRALEARMLAEGNLEALAPKIPIQQQSINMPSNEQGTVEGSIEAAAARNALRKAISKERKAKIRESNYLRSM